MKKVAFLFCCAVFAVNVVAGGSATLSCSSSNYPVVSLSYSPDGNIGVPGAIYIGVLDASRKGGAVLTPGDSWAAYQGGSFPIYRSYSDGLPGSVSTLLQLPNGSRNTSEYVGYTLYGGHGAFTPEYRAKVSQMIATNQKIKEGFIRRGEWTPARESRSISDMSMVQAAVEHDFSQNGKVTQLLTIPYLDCTPPPVKEAAVVTVGGATTVVVGKTLEEKNKCLKVYNVSSGGPVDYSTFLACMGTPK